VESAVLTDRFTQSLNVCDVYPAYTITAHKAWGSLPAAAGQRWLSSVSLDPVSGMNYFRAAFSRVLILAAAVIASALLVQGFEVVSPDGGFSYQLPKGWKVKNATGARYKVAVDPHEKAKIVVNTTLAIHVFDDLVNGRNFFPIAVERFRYETLKRAAKRDPDFKVIDNSKFTTNSNQQGLHTLLRVNEMAFCFTTLCTFSNTTLGSYGLFVADREMDQWITS